MLPRYSSLPLLLVGMVYGLYDVSLVLGSSSSKPASTAGTGSGIPALNEDDNERRRRHPQPTYQYKTLNELFTEVWSRIDNTTLLITIGLLIGTCLLQYWFTRRHEPQDNGTQEGNSEASLSKASSLSSSSSSSSSSPSLSSSSAVSSSRTPTLIEKPFLSSITATDTTIRGDTEDTNSSDSEDEEEINPPQPPPGLPYLTTSSPSSSLLRSAFAPNLSPSSSSISYSPSSTVPSSSSFLVTDTNQTKKSTLRLPKDLSCQDIFEWDSTEGGPDHIGTGTTCLVYHCRLRTDRPAVWDQYWAAKRRGPLPSQLCVKVYNENSLKFIDSSSIDPKVIKRELKSMTIAPHPHIIQVIHVFLVTVPSVPTSQSTGSTAVTSPTAAPTARRATRFQSVYVIQEYAPGVKDIVRNLQSLNPLQRKLVLKKGGGGSELYRYLYKRRILDKDGQEIKGIGIHEVTLKYILAQILLGVMALHERRIPLMHRDLKPENIVVVDEYIHSINDDFGNTVDIKIPFVKLMDFGFARTVPVHVLENLRNGGDGGNQADIFHTGLLGSGQYIAPEIAACEMDDGDRLCKEDDSELDGFKPATSPLGSSGSSSTTNPGSNGSTSNTTGKPPVSPSTRMLKKTSSDGSMSDFLSTDIFRPIQNITFIAKYGIQCDIYSLGIVLYFAATLEKTCSVLAYPSGIHDDVHAPNKIANVLSPEGQVLLWKMVALNPNERPSARECLRSPWFNDIREPFSRYFGNRILITMMAEEGETSKTIG